MAQQFIVIIFAAAALLVLAGVSFLSDQKSLSNIKAKPVGDGQHGTARWATPKEIGKTFSHIPFHPAEWRQGKNLPKVQGLVMGSLGKKGKITALVDSDDIHCLMIGAAGVGKPTDYSVMFAALDKLMAANLPQMELYREIGRVVSGRPEKGAAVAAAEYLHSVYPDVAGFSPRSLRRMRDFYRTYESAPEIMADAMTIGWTQNVVIMEAELTLQEKAWYIRAVRKFGWSKSELAKRITASAHLEIALDLPEEVCYTGNSNTVYPSSKAQASGVWHRPRRKNRVATHLLRLRQVRPPSRDEPGQPTEYSPYLRRRRWRQEAFADGLCRPPRR